jgi:hypothetical protein
MYILLILNLALDELVFKWFGFFLILLTAIKFCLILDRCNCEFQI